MATIANETGSLVAADMVSLSAFPDRIGLAGG